MRPALLSRRTRSRFMSDSLLVFLRGD